MQLTIANNLISSKDSEEDSFMHSKIDKIEIMINDEADEIIKELFDSLKKIYQNKLEWIKGSEFVFDYVQLLYYKFQNLNLNCGALIIDSPDWREKLKNKNNSDQKKKIIMFLIPCGSSVKWWRNMKTFWKNNKNQTFYK